MNLTDTPTPTGNEQALVETVSSIHPFSRLFTGFLSDGSFIAIWTAPVPEQRDTFQLFFQRWNADGQVIVEQTKLEEATTLVNSVEVLDDDRIFLVWSNDITGDENSEWLIVNPDGSTSGSPYAIGPSDIESYAHQGTEIGNNRVVATWSSEDGSTGDDQFTGISGQIYSTNGSAVGDPFLINQVTSYRQWTPEITTLADGKFVVTWLSQVPSAAYFWNLDIRARVFNADGTPAGDEIVVTTTPIYEDREARVVALDDGGFVISWIESRFRDPGNPGTDIKFRIYDEDGDPVGVEIVANSDIHDRQFEYDVTRLENGELVFVWGSGDRDVFGQVFSSSGEKIGEEFSVNTTTDGEQRGVSVAANDDGGFRVSWISYSEYGEREIYIKSQDYGPGGSELVLDDSDLVFEGQGKLSFLSQYALAAYALLNRENRDANVNNFSDNAQSARSGDENFEGIPGRLRMLTERDLPALKPVASDGDAFPYDGLSNGTYTNENAAALVSRSGDALFIAIRGTNDLPSEEGSVFEDLLLSTPDKDHWVGKGDHYELLEPLIDELKLYVNDKSNGIKKVYITGHSLGAAMVEAILEDWGSNKIEAVTFASPGFGFPDLPGEPRATHFWIAGDPILAPALFTDNDGDANLIFHNLVEGENLDNRDSLHSAVLYHNFLDFFEREGLELEDFQNLNGQNYRNIHAHVKVIDEENEQFEIGTEDDEISGSGSKDIILGGDGADKLLGFAGRDYLMGGDGEDDIKGGRHSDFLFGGADDDILKGEAGNDDIRGDAGKDELQGGGGKDTLVGGLGEDILTGNGRKDVFVFLDALDSQKGAKKRDKITDFRSKQDDIDVSEIDAKLGPKNQSFTFIGKDDFSGKKGELRYERKTSSDQTIIEADRDGDGKADLQIELVGAMNLLESDFIL